MKYKGFFKNKTALITGAANGLGRALAKILASEACHLILVDIDTGGLKEVSNGLSNSEIRFSIHSIDISVSDQVEELKLEALKIHPQIHFLFNCAGVSVTAPFLEQSLEDLHWLMSINYFGSLHTCRVFLPLLLQTSRSHIVNVSSGIAFQGLPNRTAYTSSKFAIRGFSEALRAELFHTSVSVSCAFPGPINTSMPDRSRVTNQKFLDKEKYYLGTKGDAPEYVAHHILSGLIKNKAEILIGSEVKTGAFFKRLFPGLVRWMVGKYPERLPV